MIKIVALGKIKDKHLESLIEDYTRRISRYHKLEIIELKDEPINSNDSIENILNREGIRILDAIAFDEYVILLDLNGKAIDSLKLAKTIDDVFNHTSKLTFVIGGSLGLSEGVRKRADLKIKLSDLTFLHQMTRLIILEQIYRSFKILNNETYHK